MTMTSESVYIIQFPSVSILQFVVGGLAKVWHIHDLHDQTRPSSEVLSSLSGSGLWVVLLPSKTSFLPTIENGVDKIRAKGLIELAGLFLMWAWSLGVFLHVLLLARHSSEMRWGYIPEAGRQQGSSCSSILDPSNSSLRFHNIRPSCSSF